jgi:hypothetical protein
MGATYKQICRLLIEIWKHLSQSGKHLIGFAWHCMNNGTVVKDLTFPVDKANAGEGWD